MNRRKDEALFQINAVAKIREWYPKLLVFHIPNQKGTRNVVDMVLLKKMGVTQGIADLEVMLGKGKSGYIECKIDDEDQTEEQVAFELYCEQNGYPYFLCATLKEVKQAMDQMLDS